MLTFKFGKKPAKLNSKLFSASTYFNADNFPPVPTSFYQPTLVSSWGVMDNDKLSCCVFSAFGHDHKKFTTEAGQPDTPTDAEVIQMYSEVTGYNPADPSTDGGTDMDQAAEYRRKTGILSNGKRFLADAYVGLHPGDCDELKTAAYFYGSVDIGISVEPYHMDQFNAGEPWDINEWYEEEQSEQAEGHCVPIVYLKDNGNFVCITWGKEQEITPRFLQAKNDESYCFLDMSRLKDSLSPEQFKYDDLKTDLAKLGS